MKEYDFLIYIGRFQPLHYGHEHVLDKALDMSKRVIVMVGSANLPPTPKNPFTYEERKSIIEDTFWEATRDEELIVRPLNDLMYDDERWLAGVQSTLTEVLLDYGNNHGFQAAGINDFKIGIIGHKKDDSSYYLDLFPSWDFVEVEQWGTVNATDIRDNYLQRAPVLPHDLCGEETIDHLKKFMLTDKFRYLVKEAEDLQKNYIDKWADAPYPPHFVTGDAVVTQAGHILLVTRGEAPGAGLLALPGGHVDVRAGDAFDNAIKELWEEARPSDGHSRKGMPMNRLRGFYTGTERRFDAPGRDPRGYYCTHAFRFVFPGGKLWDVAGGLAIDGETNDVTEARWYPIASLDPRKMFADHYFIIQQMLSQKGNR